MTIAPTKTERLFEPFALAVASGVSIRDAADSVGLGLKSAYLLAKEDGFRLRVGEIRTEATTQAVGKLAKLSVKAVEALEDALQNGNATAKLHAAKIVLQHLIPLSENFELRQRVDDIERQVAERDPLPHR